MRNCRNDRVAAENFQQHAEHYLRLLSEAQREMDQRREEQERQNRERQAERDRERAERQERESSQGGGDQRENDPSSVPQPEILASGKEDEGDSGLVETPESKPKPKRAPRRKPKPKVDGEDGGGDQPEAAE